MPLQGSGTFAVEAAVGTLVPRDGHVLVLDNGAYCKRIAQARDADGPRARRSIDGAEDVPVSAARRRRAARAPIRSITHVGLIHCETGTGILNPLAGDRRRSCARHGKGLIVDAMSSFGALPIDARTMPFRRADRGQRASASKACPAWASCSSRKAVLERCAGQLQSLAMDLHDQHAYMEKTGQWRFTPPTHVVAALRRGARPVHRTKAASRRGWRATPTTAGP